MGHVSQLDPGLVRVTLLSERVWVPRLNTSLPQLPPPPSPTPQTVLHPPPPTQVLPQNTQKDV